MRRFVFSLAVAVSALVAPWPLTLGLVALGALRFRCFAEGAAIFAALEGASTPDRSGVAWLPLTAAALALAALAELLRPILAPGPRATV